MQNKMQKLLFFNKKIITCKSNTYYYGKVIIINSLCTSFILLYNKVYNAYINVYNKILKLRNLRN